MHLLSIIVSGQHEGALSAAIRWVELMILGSSATSVAIIAVAVLGFKMLSGRFEFRAAGRVALGAFILFGAPLIAYEMTNALRGSEISAPDLAQQSTPAPAAPLLPKDAPVNDPYAGASVPQLQ